MTNSMTRSLRTPLSPLSRVLSLKLEAAAGNRLARVPNSLPGKPKHGVKDCRRFLLGERVAAVIVILAYGWSPPAHAAPGVSGEMSGDMPDRWTLEETRRLRSFQEVMTDSVLADLEQVRELSAAHENAIAFSVFASFRALKGAPSDPETRARLLNQLVEELTFNVPASRHPAELRVVRLPKIAIFATQFPSAAAPDVLFGLTRLERDLTSPSSPNALLATRILRHFMQAFLQARGQNSAIAVLGVFWLRDYPAVLKVFLSVVFKDSVIRRCVRDEDPQLASLLSALPGFHPGAYQPLAGDLLRDRHFLGSTLAEPLEKWFHPATSVQAADHHADFCQVFFSQLDKLFPAGEAAEIYHAGWKVVDAQSQSAPRASSRLLTREEHALQSIFAGKRSVYQDFGADYPPVATPHPLALTPGSPPWAQGSAGQAPTTTQEAPLDRQARQAASTNPPLPPAAAAGSHPLALQHLPSLTLPPTSPTPAPSTAAASGSGSGPGSLAGLTFATTQQAPHSTSLPAASGGEAKRYPTRKRKSPIPPSSPTSTAQDPLALERLKELLAEEEREEDAKLEVKESGFLQKMQIHGQNGLYAKVPLKKGALIGYYRGIIFNTFGDRDARIDALLQKLSPGERAGCDDSYLLDVMDPKKPTKLEYLIDAFFKGFGSSRRSRAAIANHDCDDDNSDWRVQKVEESQNNDLLFPRGYSAGVYATRDIAAGEEILVDYGPGYHEALIKKHPDYKKFVDERDKAKTLPTDLSTQLPSNDDFMHLLAAEAAKLQEKDASLDGAESVPPTAQAPRQYQPAPAAHSAPSGGARVQSAGAAEKPHPRLAQGQTAPERSAPGGFPSGAAPDETQFEASQGALPPTGQQPSRREALRERFYQLLTEAAPGTSDEGQTNLTNLTNLMALTELQKEFTKELKAAQKSATAQSAKETLMPDKVIRGYDRSLVHWRRLERLVQRAEQWSQNLGTETLSAEEEIRLVKLFSDMKATNIWEKIGNTLYNQANAYEGLGELIPYTAQLTGSKTATPLKQDFLQKAVRVLEEALANYHLMLGVFATPLHPLISRSGESPATIKEHLQCTERELAEGKARLQKLQHNLAKGVEEDLNDLVKKAGKALHWIVQRAQLRGSVASTGGTRNQVEGQEVDLTSDAPPFFLERTLLEPAAAHRLLNELVDMLLTSAKHREELLWSIGQCYLVQATLLNQKQDLSAHQQQLGITMLRKADVFFSRLKNKEAIRIRWQALLKKVEKITEPLRVRFSPPQAPGA